MLRSIIGPLPSDAAGDVTAAPECGSSMFVMACRNRADDDGVQWLEHQYFFSGRKPMGNVEVAGDPGCGFRLMMLNGDKLRLGMLDQGRHVRRCTPGTRTEAQRTCFKTLLASCRWPFARHRA